jgi:quercetin dioxygenase-like cupin family protein
MGAVCAPKTAARHGATDGSAMTHIAIQDSVDGKPVDWLEHVTDEQYLQNS